MVRSAVMLLLLLLLLAGTVTVVMGREDFWWIDGYPAVVVVGKMEEMESGRGVNSEDGREREAGAGVEM